MSTSRHVAFLALLLLPFSSILAQPTAATSAAFEVRIGTTISRQGKFATISAYMEKALTLFQEVVNSKFPFKNSKGANISVKIDMTRDDQSDTTLVKEHFRDMALQSSYDFLLGPYSSGLSIIAAEVANSSQKVVMFHTAASPQVYVTAAGAPKWQYVFAVNPMAADYFVDALDILRTMGAKTMTVARGSALFHNALCDGAVQYGLSVGYALLGDFSIDGSDITNSIRASRALEADVFVGCGHLSNAVSIAVTSRALMFNPKAMLLATSTSSAFVDAIESKNANFIMGPVTWAKEIQSPVDKVFGSSQNFNDMYTARWGVQPTFQAAMTASAATVLMLAAEILGVPSPSSTAIRNALLANNFATITGTNKFNVTGQRFQARGYTQQIVPDPHASTPGQRYTQSFMKLVTANDLPRFPAPTWEQKELEVYPCPPGSERNRSSSNVEDCVLCPRGKTRGNTSLICRTCDGNTYSDQVGMAECSPCEVGMLCSRNHAHDTLAAPGYYRLWDTQKNMYTFFKCDPPEVCVGANQCLGSNRGILCDECPRGYSNKGWGALGDIRGECGKCAGHWFNTLWFFAMLAIYIGFMVMLSVSDHASSHSLSALHGVILKIVVNYGQFMSAMMLATDFQTFKDVPQLRVAIEMILNPLQSMLSFDCLTRALNVRGDHAGVIVGFMLVPLGLVTSWLLFSCFAIVIMRNVRWRQTGRRHRLKDDGGVPSMFEVRCRGADGDNRMSIGADGTPCAESQDKLGVSDHSSVGSMGYGTAMTATTTSRDFVDDCSDTDGEEDPVEWSDGKAQQNEDTNESARTGSIPRNLTTSTVFPKKVRLDYAQTRQKFRELLATADPGAQDEIWRHLFAFWVRTAVISSFILHPIAMRMMLFALDCVPLDTLRLKVALGSVCNEGGHTKWFYGAILGLIVYGVGVPFATWKILGSVSEELLNIDVRRKFGFLYNGFERAYYNFEVWYMFRKFLLLFAVAIPEIYARMFTMMVMALMFMAAQIAFRPWDNRGYYIFDQLETLSILALICSLMLRLLLEIRTDVTGDTVQFMKGRGFAIAGSIFVLFFHISFLLLAAWGLVRNNIIKRLLFRKEILPGSLNRAERLLCRLDEHRYNRMTMEIKTHRLDMTKLTNSERGLLQSCLCDTLKIYMAAAQDSDARKEHPLLRLDLIGCAIREAFRTCERSRRHKLKKYLLSCQKDLLQQGGGPSASHEMAPWVTSLSSDINMERLQKAAHHFARSGGITVEEFQVALMISWPEILAGREEYYTMQTVEDVDQILNEQARRDQLVWGADRSLNKMLDILERREHCNAARFDGDFLEAATGHDGRVNLETASIAPSVASEISNSAFADAMGQLGLEGAGTGRLMPFALNDDGGEDSMFESRTNENVLSEFFDLKGHVTRLKSRCLLVASADHTLKRSGPSQMGHISSPAQPASANRISVRSGPSHMGHLSSPVQPECPQAFDTKVDARLSPVIEEDLASPFSEEDLASRASPLNQIKILESWPHFTGDVLSVDEGGTAVGAIDAINIMPQKIRGLESGVPADSHVWWPWKSNGEATVQNSSNGEDIGSKDIGVHSSQVSSLAAVPNRTISHNLSPDTNSKRQSPIQSAFQPFSGESLPHSAGSQLPNSTLQLPELELRSGPSTFAFGIQQETAI